MADLWGAISFYRDQMERTSRPITKARGKTDQHQSTIFSRAYYQNFQRYPEGNLDMAADDR